MPLPSDATLTLQGQSRPGDPLHSKPKKAILLRMSAETFEQLEDAQNLPKLQFEFGNTPGLYIDNTFYPVRADPENGNHELYLRMASAQKPMAPLKMYANVVGKLTVERQLGEKVEGTIRDRTVEAEKQRTERKAIYLDTPPDLSYPGAKTKGRKDTTAPRRPVVSSVSRPPSNIRTSRVASPLPGTLSHANGSANEVPPTRARLIHCLALKPRTIEQAIAMCAGKDPSPQMKKELIALLHAVAEPKPVAKTSDSNGPQPWQLKPESWLDVRPYEWPSLEPEERTAMSRRARAIYGQLKIPESDPVWEHARYREVGGHDAGPSAKRIGGSSAPAAEPKKGIMSKGTTKKTKPAEGVRKKAPGIIIAKDESARPGTGEANGKGKARERELDEGSSAGTPSSATRPQIRRPGSGYKAKASATPPAAELRANSPLPPPPKRTGPVDARESKRERELPAPSGSARPLPPIAAPAASPQPKASTPQFRKKTKDTTERAVEERREERQRERERQDAADERQRLKGLGSPIPVKRKKPARDANDSEYSERETPLSSVAPKKRRLEDQQSAAEKPRARDLSLPKKPVLREPSPLGPPRTKVKKEPSPLSVAFSPPPAARSSLPPRPSMPENPQPPLSSSSSSTSTKDEAPHRASSSSKRRRSSIHFTSSDESDPPPRGRATTRGTADEPAAKKLKSQAQAKAKGPAHFKPRASLPADGPGLRKYYKSCFLVYIQLYQEQAQRRDRIERILEGGSDAEASGDDDDLDPDALTAFMDELKAVTDEMNRIKAAWESLGGSVDSSGELVE